MKTKKGFLLRRMNDEYMVIAIGAASEQFNGMIRLNEAGAFLWKELEQGIDEEALVRKMTERYHGLDAQTARADLEEFLTSIAVAIER